MIRINLYVGKQSLSSLREEITFQDVAVTDFWKYPRNNRQSDADHDNYPSATSMEAPSLAMGSDYKVGTIIGTAHVYIKVHICQQWSNFWLNILMWLCGCCHFSHQLFHATHAVILKLAVLVLVVPSSKYWNRGLTCPFKLSHATTQPRDVMNVKLNFEVVCSSWWTLITRTMIISRGNL